MGMGVCEIIVFTAEEILHWKNILGGAVCQYNQASVAIYFLICRFNLLQIKNIFLKIPEISKKWNFNL